MDYRIDQLPKNERPREKLHELGTDSLTEVELLSLILRTGSPGKNVKELAAEILNSYSLGSIADRPLDELKNFEGVSDVKAGQLKAVSQIAREIQNEEKEKIENFKDAKKMVQDMKFMEEEVLRVFVLSSGNEVLGYEDLRGTASNVKFQAGDIFRPALRKNGSAVIIAHNHPSRDPNPTPEDLEATKEVTEAGRKLDIGVLDHLIVGEKITSMKKKTSIKF